MSTHQGFQPGPSSEILRARAMEKLSGKPAPPVVEASPCELVVHPAHGTVALESGQAFAYTPSPASGERKDSFKMSYQHDGRIYEIWVRVDVKDCGKIVDWVSPVGSCTEIAIASRK